VRLADDLPGTGSKPGDGGVSGGLRSQGLLLLRSRSPASQAPTPFGQKRVFAGFPISGWAQGFAANSP